jgi:hypothetical protein
MLHQLQHLDRAVHGLAPRHALVQAHALGDLLADRCRPGSGSVIGSWKMMAISLARIFCISAGQRHQVAALPHHLAGDDLARRHVDQLHHRLGGDALAAAGLADHATVSPASMAMSTPVDRVQPAVVGLEVGLQAP